MPNTLFVRPLQSTISHSVEDKQYEWALYDLGGTLLKYNGGTTLDIIDQTLMQNGLDHIELIGLLPASSAFCADVTVPGNQTRYIQQALPFAVEDQIAQDIEQMHLVLGDKVKSGAYRVVCVDHEVFTPFFDRLNDEALIASLKSVHLDSDLIDVEKGTLKIVLSATHAHVSGFNQSISIQNQNLIPYLDALFLARDDDSVDNIDINVVLDKAATSASKMLIAEIEQYTGVSIHITEYPLTAFEYLCDEYFKLKKTPTNLCQGPYQLSSKSQGAWHRWRAVALIAGIGFLLQLGVLIGQGVYTNQQTERINSQAIDMYKSAVPGARKISVAKLPRIIKGQLKQLKSAGGEKIEFLDLLGEAGYHHSQNQNKSSLRFHSINYNEQRGELLIELHAQSFDQLESLKKSIVDSGLTAKISSAVQEKDYFKGRISVSGA